MAGIQRYTEAFVDATTKLIDNVSSVFGRMVLANAILHM